MASNARVPSRAPPTNKTRATCRRPTRGISLGSGAVVAALVLTIALFPAPIADASGSSLDDQAPAVWQESGRLASVAPDVAGGGGGMDFGAAVAVDGDIAVVGLPSQDLAYVYEQTGRIWQEREVLTGPPGFGSSLAIDGDRIVVGAPADSSVHIYERDATVWTTDPTVLRQNGGCLGASLDIDGAAIVAGDRCESGSAFVYLLQSSGWTLADRLDITGETPFFRMPVAIDEDTVVVGTGTETNVYEREGATSLSWSLVAEISSRWSFLVEVHGETIATAGPDSVEVYEDLEAGWVRTADLEPRDSSPLAAGHAFGASIALGHETLVVGAPEDDATPGIPDVPEDTDEVCVSQFGFGACVPPVPGAAYTFASTDEGEWVQTAKLTGSPAGDDEFGKAVAMDDDGSQALVGAPAELKNSALGSQNVDPVDSVHVFERISRVGS